MDDILILRDGWIVSSLRDVKRGDIFTFILPGTPKEGDDQNPIGEDIYKAKADAKQDGTSWIVSIEKPDQPHWLSSYLDKLAVIGVSIQVKGTGLYDDLGFKTISG